MVDLTRRQFTGAGVAGMALSGPAARMASAATGAPPNILVFVADDAGARHFGCYGNPTIRTPHIDRLAAEGLTFDNAHLTTPQCSPSRISILTGLYPHATGAEDLHMPMPKEHEVVPGYLRQQGYFTGMMQKTHIGPYAEARFHWYDPELDGLDRFLDSAKEKPFFMWVAFGDPHRPADPETGLPTYAKGAVEPPHDPAKVAVAPYHADTPETREDIARYYDYIARMDGVIGEQMATLERRGLLDNTLVVFLSDNGAPFPREKGALYDGGVKTPLIFRWPSRVPAGRRYGGVASVIDLAPTFVDLAGMAVPDVMQGQSIKAGLFNPDRLSRAQAFSERNWHDTDEHIRSIRTERYRLIHNAYVHLPHGSPADVSESPTWRALYARKQAGTLTPAQARLFEVPRPEIEFYDLEADPWEVTNLAGDPAYRALIRDHFAELARWRESTGDFPPHERRRAGHTDRVTGVYFGDSIPPQR
ncbi:sulfatase family protein [Yunchengibacter salinarum]|uniref:sulfatase family protein n=1 Tax=Yunchengibacter salinarum TaxID=3133399 RepID=UPI0035B6A234